MSESQEASPAAPSEEDDLGVLAISALLSSRVCHDLINPVGAIGSGLEVLDDPEMEDTMREAALDLIRSGAKKALALLSYARLAYGAAGGFGAQINMDDARKALQDVYDTVKPDLAWGLGSGLAAKENVKVLMILAYAAADCAPRGGLVEINGDISDFTIRVTGKRLLLQEDLKKALAGDPSDLAPKFTPALLVSQIIAECGGTLSAEMTEEEVLFKANFSHD